MLKTAGNAYNEGYNKGVEMASSASASAASMAGTAVGATVSFAGSSVSSAKGVLQERAPLVLDVAEVALSGAWNVLGAVGKMVAKGSTETTQGLAKKEDTTEDDAKK